MESLEYQEIYITHFKSVYKYVLSLCKNTDIAEEITQETFFKALKNMDDFKGNCKIYSWLCQIAKNTLYNYLKANKKYVPLDEQLYSQTDEKDPETVCLIIEEADKAHLLLHNLSEPYKEVFMLRIFAELSFEKIGNLFGKSDSWARVVFYRAKNRLQEGMK